jgi:Kef-type K+ transport system membrane component KefB
LPFALGYATCRALGLENLIAIVAGATLTATSVGITARVLSDLHRLHEPESQIILGAAVIDDVIGLVILAVVGGLTQGKEVTPLGVVQTTAIAFGFLAGVLVIGNFVLPPIAKLVNRIHAPDIATTFAIIFTFALAWLADAAGSALIIGGFAAGLLLRNTVLAEEAEHGVAALGHFFVPLFFLSVGSAVDVRAFNPFVAENGHTLLIGGALIVVAIIGKFAAGYAPYWFKGRKHVIGVGMIPRGEVGLIFAQMGLSAGVFTAKMFSAVTLMVMVTTFLAPPLLKMSFPKSPRRKRGKPDEEASGISELVADG